MYRVDLRDLKYEIISLDLRSQIEDERRIDWGRKYFV